MQFELELRMIHVLYAFLERLYVLKLCQNLKNKERQCRHSACTGAVSEGCPEGVAKPSLTSKSPVAASA